MGADAVQKRLIKYFFILLLCASCTGKPASRVDNTPDLVPGDNIITLSNGDIINVQKNWGIGMLGEGEGTESFIFYEIYLKDKFVPLDNDYYNDIPSTKYDYKRECLTKNISFNYTPEFQLIITNRDAENSCVITEIEYYRIKDYKFVKI